MAYYSQNGIPNGSTPYSSYNQNNSNAQHQQYFNNNANGHSRNASDLPQWLQHGRQGSHGGSPPVPHPQSSPRPHAYPDTLPPDMLPPATAPVYSHQHTESRGRPGQTSPPLPSPGFIPQSNSRPNSRPSSKGPNHRRILSGFQPDRRASSQERTLLDLKRLSLQGSQTHLPVQPVQASVAYQSPYQPPAPGPTVRRHAAACNGCGADPLRGTRWHCQRCPDEDLCDGCKQGGVKKAHPFAPLEVGIETHGPIYCDGCGQKAKPLYGPRYNCHRHHDEDWCDDCIKSSRACGGPYDVHRSTDLGMQIEQYGCVTLPAEWIPYLQPPTGAVYNVEREDGSAKNWRSNADNLYWYGRPQRDRVWEAPENPVFKMSITQKKGHFISDHEFDWVMKYFSDKQKVFSYAHAQDRHSGKIKNQALVDAVHGKRLRMDWAHGPAYDQLAFTLPTGHRQFRWVTNKPVSAIFPERWDTQRYALFEKTAPGVEVIVADFAWWDGHHDAPEDLLTIRSPTLDHALVIATLTVVIDHQFAILGQEYDADPRGVQKTEDMARLTPLGRMLYFIEEDHATDTGKGQAKSGSRMNYHTVHAALETTNLALEATNNIISAVDSGSGGSY